jgi:hypothetical protein
MLQAELTVIPSCFSFPEIIVTVIYTCGTKKARGLVVDKRHITGKRSECAWGAGAA